MVGLERPRRGASGYGLHHGGLDLEKIPGIEEGAYRLNDPGPGNEDLLHVGIDDEIDVALTVTDLHIGQSMPFLGERTEGFREEQKGFHVQGEFFGPGPEEKSLHADEIAYIKFLEKVETFLAEVFFWK